MQSTLTRYGHRAVAATALPYALRGAMRYYNSRSTRGRQGMKRKRGSRTRTMQKRKRKTSGLGVTFEHDRQPIYLRKPMPFKKKRNWIQFNKKVNAVAEKELGTRTVVFNTQFNAINDIETNHGVRDVALYSLNSTRAQGNDLNNISALETRQVHQNKVNSSIYRQNVYSRAEY